MAKKPRNAARYTQKVHTSLGRRFLREFTTLQRCKLTQQRVLEKRHVHNSKTVEFTGRSIMAKVAQNLILAIVTSIVSLESVMILTWTLQNDYV